MKKFVLLLSIIGLVSVIGINFYPAEAYALDPQPEPELTVPMKAETKEEMKARHCDMLETSEDAIMFIINGMVIESTLSYDPNALMKAIRVLQSINTQQGMVGCDDED